MSKYLTKISRRVINSLLVILLSAALFGFWFKKGQLNFISPDLMLFYPLSYWAESLFFIFLFFILWWLLWGAVFKRIFGPADLPRFLSYQAATFLWFTFVLLNVPLKICTYFFLLSQAGIFLFYAAKKPPSLTPSLKGHGYAFLLILAVYLFSCCFFSPFFWANPLTSYIDKGFATGTIPTSVSLHKAGYINAKFHSFSELDPSYWGGAVRPLTGLYSVLVPVLVFFFDLPAIDVEWYHRLLFIITFTSCVLGSFGFYLFLFRGIGLSYCVALFGGMFLVFGNRFFVETLITDYPVYYLYFLILPYSLFLIRRGFAKSNMVLCAASGILLGLPFYILAPHPQSALLALLFYALYVFFLFVFNREVPSYYQKLKFILISAIAAGISVLSYLAPVLDAVQNRELIYFGHKNVNKFLILTNKIFVENLLALAAIVLFVCLNFLRTHRLKDRERKAGWSPLQFGFHGF